MLDIDDDENAPIRRPDADGKRKIYEAAAPEAQKILNCYCNCPKEKRDEIWKLILVDDDAAAPPEASGIFDRYRNASRKIRDQVWQLIVLANGDAERDRRASRKALDLPWAETGAAPTTGSHT